MTVAPIPYPLAWLSHGRASRDHFHQTPALQFRHGTRLDDSYGIARTGLALLVMSVKFLRDPHHAVVKAMLHQANNLDHDGLLHLGARDAADFFLPHVPFRRSGQRRFGGFSFHNPSSSCSLNRPSSTRARAKEF